MNQSETELLERLERREAIELLASIQNGKEIMKPEPRHVFTLLEIESEE